MYGNPRDVGPLPAPQQNPRPRPRPRTSPSRRSRRARLLVENSEGKALLSADALDPTFGVGGRLTSELLNGGSVALQADGGMVAAGTVLDEAGLGGIVVTRLNPDGTLDTSFGAGGMASMNMSPAPDIDGERVAVVVVQGDGKIVVGGTAVTFADGASSGEFALARFLSDGTPDADFGSGGKVITPFAYGTPDDLKGYVAVCDDATASSERTSSPRARVASSTA